MMRRKSSVIIFSLLLVILSGVLAAYIECAEAAIHHDFDAEHESQSIHCPDAFLHQNIQAASTAQAQIRTLSRALPSTCTKIDSVASIAQFTDHPFRKLFSQQDLFRFKETYRL